MDPDPPQNPKRFPGNAAGEFYTTGYVSPSVEGASAPPCWAGDCLFCGAPEYEAPDLLAVLDEENSDTYFVRQPRTEPEVERACSAVESCCVEALRYAGRDPAIIRRLGNHPGYCDHVILRGGELARVLDERGDLLPFAADLCRRPTRRWWEFWKR